MPAPTGRVRADTAVAHSAELRGRLDWADSYRPWSGVTVTLARGNWTRSARVVADTFRILEVAPGDYEMRTSLFGQRSRVDAVRVPPQGTAVIVPFAQVMMLDGCGNGVTTVPVQP